jgi:fibronectin type III domain protein
MVTLAKPGTSDRCTARGPVPSLLPTLRTVTDRKSRGWRGNGPFALFVLVCVAALVAALTGATKPLAGTQFALTGHWVYNALLQTAFHIDGGTTNIDAQAQIPGEHGSQVVQGDISGFVVGATRITEFGKSNLSVQRTIEPPADEVPMGLEVVGGPYLVYRNAGKIVRLGDPAATISAGTAVGDPVATSDGTIWLHRTGIGQICTLPKGADRIAGCPVSAPKDHFGALTVVGDRPEFVDLFAGMVQTVEGDHLGAGVPLGVPVSPNSRPAANDVAGRVAILDPARHSILLADTHSPPATPVTVALPGGDYDGPVSTGSVFVLVDRQSGAVLTFGADGSRKDEKPIKNKTGQPRLSRGEDNRVYVEDADGTQVLVVAKDGKVQDVPVVGKPTTPKPDEKADKPEQHQPVEQPGDPHKPAQQPGEPRGPAAPPPAPKPKPPPPAVPASPPGAPSSVSATAADSSAIVTWGAAPDNRSPVTSYRVSWQTGSVTVSGGARRATINGLTNGVRYVLTVTATNAAGTGPGASAAPVTPFAAAAAPKPTAQARGGGATLSWAAPDLRGGTLVHYLVNATGQADRTVTTTSTVYNGPTAGQTITFTVRAVTRTADGQTLNGAPGSTTLTMPAPTPAIQISRGRSTTSGNCHAPNCAFVNATMTGFAPNTPYDITLSSSSNPDVRTESFRTDANGSATYNQLDYDVPGQTVWIRVGSVTSNRIRW